MKTTTNSTPELLEEGIDYFSQMIREQEPFGKRPLVVAVVGGGAVGKSTVIVPGLVRRFPGAVAIAEDNYCIGNKASATLHGGTPHLLTPEDYQPELLTRHIEEIKDGKPVVVPVYDYARREPSGETSAVKPDRLVILEGAYLLHPPLRSAIDLALFVSVDEHSRFARTVIRPRRNPAQSDAARLRQYFELTFPSYATHTESTSGSADMVIANPYCPQEGLRCIVASPLPVDPSDRYKRFVHPNMAAQELVALAAVRGGAQRLIYMPSQVHRDTYVSFDVPPAEYILDPTKIGYSRYEA